MSDPDSREKMKILVVDDMPDNPALMGNLFKHDYGLKVASNKEDALRIAGSVLRGQNRLLERDVLEVEASNERTRLQGGQDQGLCDKIVAGNDRQLHHQRDIRGNRAPDLQAVRRRSGHRPNHFPCHSDGLDQHGHAVGPGRAPRT